MKMCPNCTPNKWVDDKYNYCRQCGGCLEEFAYPKCRVCENELYTTDKYCPYCGNKTWFTEERPW